MIEEYEKARTDKYGFAGSTTRTLDPEKRSTIMTAIDKLVEHTGAAYREAMAVTCKIWMKEFPGHENKIANRQHPLSYLAGDIGDVIVKAAKELRKPIGPKKTVPKENVELPDELEAVKMTAEMGRNLYKSLSSTHEVNADDKWKPPVQRPKL